MSFKFSGNSAGGKVIVSPKIVVMGIGGAGCNAVNNMISSDLKGVYFIVANTDAQSLATSLCENRIQLGAGLTSGLGAGSAPDIGRKAAEESVNEIEDYIKDANMLFLAAGMGGGTGTGATPVIAKLAKELGILTVGVVTKPFHFEQQTRLQVAEEGLEELDRYCDTLIVISNQKLFGVANEETTFANAFKMADNVLVSGVKCITNLITNPGIVNLDFADVKSVMSSLGRAIMGEGEASGERRAITAAEEAITNPLLEHSSIVGASSILINITSGPDITLFEVNDIMQRITDELGNCAVSKFGSVIDDAMEGIIRVSIVATGIKTESKTQHENDDIRNKFAPQSDKYYEAKKDNSQFHQDQFTQESFNQEKDRVSENTIDQEAVKTNPSKQTSWKDENNREQFTSNDEIIFDDLSDETDTDLDSNTFFIPPAARRVGAKKTQIETSYSGGNGLFSKIFNKKS